MNIIKLTIVTKVKIKKIYTQFQLFLHFASKKKVKQQKQFTFKRFLLCTFKVQIHTAITLEEEYIKHVHVSKFKYKLLITIGSTNFHFAIYMHHAITRIHLAVWPVPTFKTGECVFVCVCVCCSSCFLSKYSFCIFVCILCISVLFRV